MSDKEYGIKEDQTFDTIEKAGNYLSGLKDKLKRRASMEEFPITTATPKEQKAYIQYCISLMNQKNLPMTSKRLIARGKAVLSLIKIYGYSYEAIAKWLRDNGFGNVTIDDVKKVEKEAMLMVKEAICRVKNNNVPILGGC